MNFIIFLILISIILYCIQILYHNFEFEKLLERTTDTKEKKKIILYRPLFYIKQLRKMFILIVLMVIGLLFSTYSLFKLENARVQENQKIVQLSISTRKTTSKQAEKLKELESIIEDNKSNNKKSEGKK